MEIINTTTRRRETYNVIIKHSLLFECALGIAAVTNSRLIDTLDNPLDSWNKTRKKLSAKLLDSLQYVETYNTWKSMLLILHQREFKGLADYTEYINNLEDRDFRFQCIPFVGYKYQDIRAQASNGNLPAIKELKELTENNSFFPDYIEFICTTNLGNLKRHLIDVMSNWYKEFVVPQTDKLMAYLERDCKSKQVMKQKMNPEEFVEWATGGINYLPEPSVHNVLLIPQYIYRPWNIEADIEDTKVFYYPIANESIHPDDRYAPNYFLVHKHKALGDEVRLRIVKLLSKKDLTLQEITNEFGVGKTTIHHHLKILRSARLVTIENSRYTLKKNAVLSLSKELGHYLEEF